MKTALLIFALALAAQLWTPHDPLALDIAHRLAPASWAHPLGTDPLGRDTLSRLLAGAAASLGVSLGAVVIGAGAGVPLGLLAAARPGWPDGLVMRAADLVFAFPALILAIMLTAVFGPSAVNAVIAIGVFNIPVFARLTRSSAASLWSRDWVLAARMAGRGAATISTAHILPNLASTLIAQATIQFALGILADAGLAYVGLGIQPPAPSWGRMLNEAQPYLDTAPWLAVWPGLAIVLTVLAFTRAGDRLGRR